MALYSRDAKGLGVETEVHGRHIRSVEGGLFETRNSRPRTPDDLFFWENCTNTGEVEVELAEG